MQQIFTVAALIASFTLPQIGMTTSSPIGVATCYTVDLLHPGAYADYQLPFPYQSLELSYRNTQDAVATRVTFDVVQAGVHTTIVDRGHFSKGVLIDRDFVNVLDGYGDTQATCSVTAVTFADGSSWTPAGGRVTTAATLP
jgi:hypothetical protein